MWHFDSYDHRGRRRRHHARFTPEWAFNITAVVQLCSHLYISLHVKSDMKKRAHCALRKSLGSEIINPAAVFNQNFNQIMIYASHGAILLIFVNSSPRLWSLRLIFLLSLFPLTLIWNFTNVDRVAVGSEGRLLMMPEQERTKIISMKPVLLPH